MRGFERSFFSPGVKIGERKKSYIFLPPYMLNTCVRRMCGKINKQKNAQEANGIGIQKLIFVYWPGASWALIIRLPLKCKKKVKNQVFVAIFSRTFAEFGALALAGDLRATFGNYQRIFRLSFFFLIRNLMGSIIRSNNDE